MPQKSLTVTKDKLMEMVAKSERMIKAARSKAGRVEQEMQHMFYAAEAGGAGFALGLLNKKYGSMDIMGVDVKLAVAIGAHLSAFMAIGGAPLSDHLHAVGNGALGVIGYEAGKKSTLFSGISGEIIDVATEAYDNE